MWPPWFELVRSHRLDSANLVITTLSNVILRGSRHVRATFHWLRASELFSCSIANRPADFFLSQSICYLLIFLAIYSHPLSGMTLRQGEVLVRSACGLVFAGVNHASGIFAVIGHSGARTSKDLLIVSQCLFQTHASLVLESEHGESTDQHVVSTEWDYAE